MAPLPPGVPVPPGRRERFPFAGLKALVRNAEPEAIPERAAGEQGKKRRHSPPPPPLPSQRETHVPGRWLRGRGAQRGSGGPGPRSRPGLAPYLPCPLRAPAAPRSAPQVCLKRPPRPAALSHPLSLPPSLSHSLQPAGKSSQPPGYGEFSSALLRGSRGTHRRGGGRSPSATPCP